MKNFDEGDWDAPYATRPEDAVSYPLAFVIDSEVVFTCRVDKWLRDMFLSTTKFEEHYVNDSIGMYQVKMYEDDKLVDILIINEMMFAILLSEPKIVEYESFRSVIPGFTYSNGSFSQVANNV